MSQGQEKFKGFYVPNSTQVPDTLFDELLSELSGAELKVVLYIIRRTFGFKRQSDTISINQLLFGITKKSGEALDKGTGLSKPTLLQALKSLTEKNIILPTRQFDEKGGFMPTEYRLNIASTPPESHHETPPSKKILPSPLGQKTFQGEAENFTKPLVKELYHTRYSKQDTDNNVNVDKEGKGSGGTEEPKTDLHKLPTLEQDKAETELIANDILHQLGDRQSFPFYYLVASRVPKREIHAALSSIKQGGATSPPKVFANRMKNYVAQRADTRSQSLHSAMQEMQKKMTLN
jgi:Bacteriophage replication protein O